MLWLGARLLRGGGGRCSRSRVWLLLLARGRRPLSVDHVGLLGLGLLGRLLLLLLAAAGLDFLDDAELHGAELVLFGADVLLLLADAVAGVLVHVGLVSEGLLALVELGLELALVCAELLEPAGPQRLLLLRRHVVKLLLLALAHLRLLQRRHASRLLSGSRRRSCLRLRLRRLLWLWLWLLLRHGMRCWRLLRWLRLWLWLLWHLLLDTWRAGLWLLLWLLWLLGPIGRRAGRLVAGLVLLENCPDALRSERLLLPLRRLWPRLRGRRHGLSVLRYKRIDLLRLQLLDPPRRVLVLRLLSATLRLLATTVALVHHHIIVAVVVHSSIPPNSSIKLSSKVYHFVIFASSITPNPPASALRVNGIPIYPQT